MARAKKRTPQVEEVPAEMLVLGRQVLCYSVRSGGTGFWWPVTIRVTGSVAAVPARRFFHVRRHDAPARRTRPLQGPRLALAPVRLSARPRPAAFIGR